MGGQSGGNFDLLGAAGEHEEIAQLRPLPKNVPKTSVFLARRRCAEKRSFRYSQHGGLKLPSFLPLPCCIHEVGMISRCWMPSMRRLGSILTATRSHPDG